MLPIRHLTVLSIALGTACGPTAARVEPFAVVRVTPDPAAGSPLALNDAISICFSGDVAPSSVTEDSCSVVDEGGHRVPGSLRVSGSHVSFLPRPPLAADLSDGSFAPGRRYRVLLAGMPRPDAIRAADGRWLECAAVFEFRTAARETPGAALLRVPLPGLPFWLVEPEVPQQVAVDAPLLRLRFTAPVAPWSVQPNALLVRRYGNPIEAIMPSRVRLVVGAGEEPPGCALEIDLTGPLRDAQGQLVRPLRAGDLLSVSLGATAAPLRDYSGTPVFATIEPCWTVVTGGAVARLQWPSADAGPLASDGVLPGFEVHGGLMVPKARTETGSGKLGLFRPLRSTRIAPGEPFDRGDGVMVAAVDGRLEFLAIDIPAGVVVTVDATTAPMRLLAVGGARIAGELQVRASPQTARRLRPGAPVEDAIESAPVALAVAGDLVVAGRVVGPTELAADSVALCLASAGRVELLTDLPFNTLLAVGADDDVDSGPAIRGSRGQATVVGVSFTRGVPHDARWTATASSDWLQVPADLTQVWLEVLDGTPEFLVRWQEAPPDPVRARLPDLSPGKASRWLPVQPHEPVALAPRSFVRFTVAADVAAGMPLPGLRAVRVVER